MKRPPLVYLKTRTQVIAEGLERIILQRNAAESSIVKSIKHLALLEEETKHLSKRVERFIRYLEKFGPF